MTTIQTFSKLQTPPDLTSKEFASNKYEYYKWMRQEAPVARCKICGWTCLRRLSLRGLRCPAKRSQSHPRQSHHRHQYSPTACVHLIT